MIQTETVTRTIETDDAKQDAALTLMRRVLAEVRALREQVGHLEHLVREGREEHTGEGDGCHGSGS